jgi:DDE superfamily endonuclease
VWWTKLKRAIVPLVTEEGSERTHQGTSKFSVAKLFGKVHIALLAEIEIANPTSDIFVITDNLPSHNSAETRAWLMEHPRIQHVFIPKKACWLNLQEGWWRLFRRDALAGQSEANADEIEQAACVATVQLNRRARPWVWERPPKTRRNLHFLFSYRL